MKAFVLIVPLITACAAVHRPPATLASLSADAKVAAGNERALTDSVIERLVRRAHQRNDRTIDILMLSGGGQHGAYGAGFLRGWRQRPGDPMPTFDLVTGISTGALQAPFALVGSEDALDTLTALYLRSAERIAPTLDWWFWLRHTGGLVTTKRYERTIDEALRGPLRQKVRAAVRDGRQLIIASTDFDLGVAHTWDFGKEFVPRDSLVDGDVVRARQLLLAATAIPSIFPPVVLDGHVHVDGGVIGNFLPIFDFSGYQRLADRLRVSGMSGDMTVRVWIIMNLWTHSTPEVVDPSSRRGIASRTDLMLLFAAQTSLLTRMSELSQAVTSGIPGLRLDVRYSAIPAELSTEPGAEKLFDKQWMLRLEKVGFDRARSATPWDPIPSVSIRPGN